MHAPITLSGKKYAPNKVYALNKQVSNYVILLFFSNNTNGVIFVLTGYGFIRAFSITRPLNASGLRKA